MHQYKYSSSKRITRYEADFSGDGYNAWTEVLDVYVCEKCGKTKKSIKMTQEEKELLLKDLTARLRYGIKILHETWNYEWDQEMSLLEKVVGIDEKFVYVKVIDTYNGEEYRDDKIPISTFDDMMFLRPMSSMTEEERDEFHKTGGVMSYSPQHDTWAISAFAPEAYDWLNKNKFDYRGLIPKGLALEAPEGMYK